MRSYLFILALLPSAGHAADVACPDTTSTSSLNAFRQEMVSKVNNSGYQDVVQGIERCFPTQVPACLTRVHRYASTRWAGSSSSNYALFDREMEMRTPPKELMLASKAGKKGAKKSTAAPDLNELSFVLSQGTGKSYQDIEAIAKKNRWPMVRYKSRHAGGFDSGTSSLLMIRIPGESQNPPLDYDRYLNIALPEDPGESSKSTREVTPVPAVKIPTQAELKSGHNMPNVFTMVSVKKSVGDTPARVFFSKFVRNDGEFKFDKELNPTTCYSCHPSGLRSISPLGYHVNEEQQMMNQVMPDSYWNAVKEMNESMVRNQGGVPPIMGQSTGPDGKKRILLDTGAQGPVYGPIHPLSHEKKTENGRTTTHFPTRTNEFLVGADGQSGCAAERKEISVRDIFGRAAGRDNRYTWIPGQTVNPDNIREAMQCESCHDGTMRGALNSSTDFSQLEFKILVDQSMPEGWHRNPLDQGSTMAPVTDRLNNNERMALASCLKAEFQQEKAKLPLWFSVQKCQGSSGGSESETKSEPSGSAE